MGRVAGEKKGGVGMLVVVVDLNQTRTKPAGAHGPRPKGNYRGRQSIGLGLLGF